MIKDEKHNTIIVIGGFCILFIYILCITTIFPYIAIQKSKKNDFKITCAYVIDKEKTKYSFNYIIFMDDKFYDHMDIFPGINYSSLKTKEWNNFPINQKSKSFLVIEPNVCKKVKYIEIYDFFGFKKFYLYDFIN